MFIAAYLFMILSLSGTLLYWHYLQECEKPQGTTLSLLGTALTYTTLALLGWVYSKPGVDGKFGQMSGHTFDVHVCHENVPHHCCGPLTPV